jgi:transcriptional regulator GlxA family with amidase domain
MAATRLVRENPPPVNHLGGLSLDARRSEHYRRIVARFEEVARGNLGTSMRIADLCRAVGVTPRTLERAVRAVHVATPLEFLHALRLTEARQTLLSKRGAAGSVTEVATRFGFRELGRFSGEYRQRFGESPSETLRRTCQGE